jgi:hypothetical protein
LIKIIGKKRPSSLKKMLLKNFKVGIKNEQRDRTSTESTLKLIMHVWDHILSNKYLGIWFKKWKSDALLA